MSDESTNGSTGTLQISASLISVVNLSAIAVGETRPLPALAAGQRAEIPLPALSPAGPVIISVDAGGLPSGKCAVVATAGDEPDATALGKACPATSFSSQLLVDTQRRVAITAPLDTAVAAGVLSLSVSQPSIAALREEATTTDPRPVVSAVAEAQCRPVFFLGARGSGQDYLDSLGYGAQVKYVLDRTAQLVGRENITAQSLLDYEAPPVPIAAFLGVAVGGVPTVVSMRDINAFIREIEEGAAAAVRLLRDQEARCGSQRIVLAGYSQGAMVMHRAVLDLVSAGDQSIVDRIDAMFLIADGDRRSSDEAFQWGGATAKPGIGVDAPSAVSKTRKAKFPAALKQRVHSICIRGDVVCNTREAGTDGARIHTDEYQKSSLVSAVVKLAVTYRLIPNLGGRTLVPIGGTCRPTTGDWGCDPIRSIDPANMTYPADVCTSRDAEGPSGWLSPPITVVNESGVSGPDRDKEIPDPPGWSGFGGTVRHYAEIYETAVVAYRDLDRRPGEEVVVRLLCSGGGTAAGYLIAVLTIRDGTPRLLGGESVGAVSTDRRHLNLRNIFDSTYNRGGNVIAATLDGQSLVTTESFDFTGLESTCCYTGRATVERRWEGTWVSRLTSSGRA
ncbi:MAG: cutinase family protein [Microthrixaceae bacterium]